MNNQSYRRTTAPRRTFSAAQAAHPAQEAVEAVIKQFEGEYQLRVTFTRDDASMSLFQRPNSVVVAYTCRLYDIEGRCLSEGRGLSFVSYQTGRYVQKAILYARNASLIDCVSRVSKLSTVFASDDVEGVDPMGAGRAALQPENQPSDKQVRYLRNLIETLPSDEQNDLLTRLPQMSRYDVSELIQTLKA